LRTGHQFARDAAFEMGAAPITVINSDTLILSLLLEPGHLVEILGVFDWVLSEIKKVENAGASPA